MITLGIIFALAALLSWGFGDFFIQRTTRTIGSLKTFFVIDFAAVLIFFPFIWKELPGVLGTLPHVVLLAGTGLVIFVAGMLDFEALRRGKIAIIEPALSFELPVTVFLASALWGEHLSLPQTLLIATTFAGIILAITVHRAHLHYHRRIFERGVLLALAGAVVMGVVNFLIGVSSQETSPLMAMWFTSVATLVPTTAFLLARGEFRTFLADLRRNPRVIAATCVLDNAAWTFYAFAASLIPISIATTISESYIALSVLLGIFISREKLKYHQIIGIIVAIASVIILSAISGG